MATIGLDKLFYAPITEDENGDEEYGKSGHPPKPFLKPARTASRTPCIEAMKRTLDQEVEKL